MTVSQDYIGGLAAPPGGSLLIAAAADGTLSLLDTRRYGARIAGATIGSPLRCCDTAANLVAIGTESGEV